MLRPLPFLLFLASLSFLTELDAVELRSDIALERHEETRVLRDGDTTMDLAQVRAAEDWKPVAGREDIYPGFDQAAFWLTIPLKNTGEEELWVLSLQNTGWEHIDWYIVRADGEIETTLGGTAREGRPGIIPGSKPNITLQLAPGEEVQLYLRCQSVTRGSLALRADKLKDYNEAAVYAIYLLSFGSVGILSIFGVILSLYAKQEGGIAYAISAFSMILFYMGLSNFAQDVGLPFSHFLSTKGIIFFSELSMLSALLYLRSFFGLGISRRWPDIAWRGLLVACMISLPLSLAIPFYPFIRWLNIQSMIFGITTFAITIWAWRQGVTYARFYVYVWPFLMFALLFDSLAREGFLPRSIPEAQGHIVVLGVVIFQLGIFIAFAERIRANFKEKARIQAKMLKTERELNDRLEDKVKSRTASLEIAANDARKANKFKDLFLANMSHEIRTPLSALIGLSQIMVRKGQEQEMPEDFRRLLRQIHSGGNHLNLMLTNLMDVSATNQGRLPLKIRDLDIHEWSKSVSDILSPLAMARKLPPINWQTDFPDIETFRSDPVRLSQILINLVHNALKFSPEDSAVEVRIALKDGTLTMDVLDNGRGIPDDPTQLFKIFERNEAPIADAEHGAGLGLYIVKTSLDLLNGEISARNRSSGGAAFHVTIPQAHEIE